MAVSVIIPTPLAMPIPANQAMTDWNAEEHEDDEEDDEDEEDDVGYTPFSMRQFMAIPDEEDTYIDGTIQQPAVYSLTPPPTPVDMAGLLNAINMLPEQMSPLLALQEKVAAFFRQGPDFASFAFIKLQESLAEQSYRLLGPYIRIQLARHSTELFSTLRNLGGLDGGVLYDYDQSGAGTFGGYDGYGAYDGLSALASLNTPRHSHSSFIRRYGPLGRPDLYHVHRVQSSSAGMQGDLWRSSRMASALVMLSAASHSEACVHGVLGKHSRLLGSPPPFQVTQSTGSASLRFAMHRARLLAQHSHRTTVLSVSIVDVRYAEMACFLGDAFWEDSRFLSFGHTITIGVGPEGVIIWQAWGPRGYRLDDYIRAGYANVRSWKEAAIFARDFDELAGSKGTWNDRRNQLYRQLFYIDINQMCKPSCLNRLITPIYEPWVRIHPICNVSYENMNKFRFV